MSTWRLLGQTWMMWVPVVVINAAVQALLVLPFVTPGASWAFVGLTLAALAAIVGSVTLVAAGFRRALAADTSAAAPWTSWLAVLLLAVAVCASALVASWLVIPAIVIALVMLPSIFGVPARTGWGFAVFRHAPLRGILLTLLSVLMVALAWFAALMFGFFVTGWVGAALSWLVLGVFGVLLMAAWFATPRRQRR